MTILWIFIVYSVASFLRHAFRGTQNTIYDIFISILIITILEFFERRWLRRRSVTQAETVSVRRHRTRHTIIHIYVNLFASFGCHWNRESQSNVLFVCMKTITLLRPNGWTAKGLPRARVSVTPFTRTQFIRFASMWRWRWHQSRLHLMFITKS